METIFLFIALCPDETEQSNWDAWKQKAAEEFHSYKALSSPLHLTLVPPFHLKANVLPVLENSLTEFVKPFYSWKLKLQGVQSFFPRTVYLSLAESSSLDQFRKDLHAEISDLEIHFTWKEAWIPHLTLLNRDLDAERCIHASKEIKSWKFPEFIELNRLIVFKKGLSIWEIEREWRLDT